MNVSHEYGVRSIRWGKRPQFLEWQEQELAVSKLEQELSIDPTALARHLWHLRSLGWRLKRKTFYSDFTVYKFWRPPCLTIRALLN